MNTDIKQLAIIGPTASGKSNLAINLAKKTSSYILSIDSLSIYKEIDIVSAKPLANELQDIKHFGINELYIDEYFSVGIFINLYKKTVKMCQKDNKNLIIVGGTSFYLKSLLTGLSPIPQIDEVTKYIVKQKLKNLNDAYNFLKKIDEKFMKNIAINDKYRIEKALLIYEASKLPPSKWFELNPLKPIIKNLDIYNIDVDKTVLRQRINKRTLTMLNIGLLDEVCYLEQKYGRVPNPMSSIGIVEVLEYLDNKVTKEVMLENISLHTTQLAKRQQTFNKTQFKNIINASLENLEKLIYL
jgi:tRNA dimethylallyltransferase